MKAHEYRKVGSFSEIGRGSSPRPIIDQAYFVNGNIPWIKIADATASFKYIYKTKEYVNEYGASFSRKLAPGSLILAASGTLGFPIFLGIEGCIHDGWLYFKTIDKNVNKQYLYYCLITFIKSFNSVSYGAAIQNINTDILRNTEIPLPPLPIQRKIAAVLSTYDDLIENNNRRIAILEKMAEELYREWFVRLRFPGHEKVRIVKGVPEGWEVRKVEDTFKFLGGGTPSTSVSSYWKDADINWYSPTDLTSSNALFSFQSKAQITELGLKESAARLFPPYSIMMTSRATIGQISINATPACTNQGFITCIPNDQVPLFYLYYWLKLNKELFIQLSNGATFLELTKGKFKNIEIVVPPARITKNFSEIQKPLFKSIETLLRKRNVLTTSRDRLLSRLMSGKLDVERLDIKFPASMMEEGNA